MNTLRRHAPGFLGIVSQRHVLQYEANDGAGNVWSQLHATEYRQLKQRTDRVVRTVGSAVFVGVALRKP